MMPFTHDVAITLKGEKGVIFGVRKRLALGNTPGWGEECPVQFKYLHFGAENRFAALDGQKAPSAASALTYS